MLFNMSNLAKNKLGITFDGVKNAPFADEPTTTRAMTPEEAQRMQTSIDTIYARFKNHVVEGRKLPAADVDSIAQGRVWTGTDALRIGLVDGMGGLDRAIFSAVKMAGVKDYRVVTYPAATDKLTTLMKKISDRTNTSMAIKKAMKEELGTGYEWYEQVQHLVKMDRKAMMLMPFVPHVE
jgi:protease-4